MHPNIATMRFPSLEVIVRQTSHVFQRFPVEIATAAFGTTAAWLLTKSPGGDVEYTLVRLLLTSLIALPAFMAVTISSEYRRSSMGIRWVGYALVFAVLLFFFYTSAGEIKIKDGIRFGHLFVAAHLLVACAGFIGRGSTEAFWQYNRILFLRIITAVIFSAVLFAGLAGALAALNALFDLNINEYWFPRIFVVVAGLFNTIFFLNGVPPNAEFLEHENEYPKVLKIFTQYVLVPLVFIYFAILLTYELKIIFQWELPNGWVSNLIIAFAIAGMLSILLVYPIRNNDENKWVQIFAKWFYLLLVPLIVLMFIAIGKRISDYGLTEERIIVLVTTCWLVFIAALFILKPKADIRIIPFSLAIVALLTQFFMFKLSESNQQNRLVKILENNELLQDGRAVKLKPGQTIQAKDAENIESIMQYLVSVHGPQSISPALQITEAELKRYSASYSVNRQLDSLGYTKHIFRGSGIVGLNSDNFEIPVSGYEKMLILDHVYEKNPHDSKASIRNGRLQVKLDEQNSFAILPDERLIRQVKYVQGTFPGTLDQDSLRYTLSTADYDVEIFYRNLSVEVLDSGYQFQTASAFILFRPKYRATDTTNIK